MWRHTVGYTEQSGENKSPRRCLDEIIDSAGNCRPLTKHIKVKVTRETTQTRTQREKKIIHKCTSAPLVPKGNVQ